MKTITNTLIICAVLLLGFTVPGAPPSGKGYHLSGVTGQVQSNILFHQWDVVATAADGTVVADVLTDASGNFEMNLKPGTYVLVAYTANLSPNGPIYGTPVTVTVDRKQFVSVVLSISIGPL